MKRNLTKAVGAGVLTLSMAIMPLTLPASAQTKTTDPGNNTTSTTTTTANDDGGFDWGWLGLLGLLGLGGLTGRKRNNEAVAYRDPNAASSTYRE